MVWEARIRKLHSGIGNTIELLAVVFSPSRPDMPTVIVLSVLGEDGVRGLLPPSAVVDADRMARR
jgi:hypothetical protein